jgi:hypothetical protein
VAGVAVYQLWTSAPDDLDPAGPWHDLHRAGSGLWFLESEETLSRVYHEAKWSLPEGSALLVTPVLARPKLKGLVAGTTAWLRDRT